MKKQMTVVVSALFAAMVQIAFATVDEIIANGGFEIVDAKNANGAQDWVLSGVRIKRVAKGGNPFNAGPGTLGEASMLMQGPGSVTATFSVSEDGEYRLSFACIGGKAGYFSGYLVDVSFDDGASMLTAVPATADEWQTETVNVALSAGEHTVTFTGTDAYSGANYLVGLDNVVIAPYVPETKVYCVTSGGSGTGAGWDDPCSFATALEKATEDDEIHCQVGTYTVTEPFSVSKALNISGGYTGNAESPDELAEEGIWSSFDGGETANILILTASSGMTSLRRLEIKNSYEHGVSKTGIGSLSLRDCRFYKNGVKNNVDLSGRGLYATGNAAASKLFISNCVFEANQIISAANADAPYGKYSGAATYVSDFRQVDFMGCNFISNGVSASAIAVNKAMPGREGMLGVCCYFKNAPVNAVGCRFVGSGSTFHGASLRGPVYLDSGCGGASFRNCAWIANWFKPWNGGATESKGGALAVNIGAGGTLEVCNCTFAYNIVKMNNTATPCSAALEIYSGNVSVVNSIFYGNVVPANGGAAADCYVRGGSATLEACLFSGTGSDNVGAADSTLKPTLITPRTGDPLFATSFSDFSTYLSATGVTTPVSAGGAQFNAADAGTKLAAIDVHVQSKTGRWNGSAWVTDEADSLALDAAKEGSDYSNEPEPNGNAANLGVYANTSEASKSASAQPAIVDLAYDTTCDYTQPHFQFTMGGSGSYVAKATLCFGLEDAGDVVEDWEHAVVLGDGCICGQKVSGGTQMYFPTGTELKWRIFVDASGTRLMAGEGVTLALDQPTPPWYGRGGEGVLHVRSNATGKNDGSSWSDAFVSLDDAFAAIGSDSSVSEIWVATNVISRSADAVALVASRAVTVRGGFDATENTVNARKPGLESAIDGNEAYTTFALATENAVTLERFAFVRAARNAMVKTGAGELVLVDCRFEDNGHWTQNAVRGAGLNATGGAVSMTGCVFAGNNFRASDQIGVGDGWHGGAAYFSQCARVTMDDCLFATNGMPAGAVRGCVGRSASRGAALYLASTPITARNCRFVGNHQSVHTDGSTGGIVYLGGSPDGKSAFTNCLWVGNASICWNTTPNVTDSGALVVAIPPEADGLPSVDVEQCTFAYNLENCQSAAGLTVKTGFVRVKDSIFWGSKNASAAGCAEINLLAGARLDLSYSLLPDKSGIAAADGVETAVSGLDGMVYGDPMFVTRANVFSEATTQTAFKDAASAMSVVNWNFHLRGRAGYYDETTGGLVKPGVDADEPRYSPAIDGGDLASAYRNEPSPNGGRVNMGFYGNTPWASLSPAGLMLIVR